MKQFLIGSRTKIADHRYFLSYRIQQLAHYFITCWLHSPWNAHRLAVHSSFSADIGRQHYRLCTQQPILFVYPSGTQDIPAWAKGAILLDTHTPIIQKLLYLRRNISPMLSSFPLAQHTTAAQLSRQHLLPVQHFITASASRFCFLHGSMYT